MHPTSWTGLCCGGRGFMSTSVTCVLITELSLGGLMQGLAFYLPNASWLQPPGYVHQMYAASWLDGALATKQQGAALSISAQVASDRSQLRLLVVNNRTTAINASITIVGWQPRADAWMTTLHAPDLGSANPPGIPDLIAPRSEQVIWTGGGDGAKSRVWSFRALSVNVLLLNRSAAATATARTAQGH
jgi:hypothetical protein